MGNPDTIIISILPLINAIFMCIFIYAIKDSYKTDWMSSLTFLWYSIIGSGMIVCLSNFISQYIVCGDSNLKLAAIGVYPTLISVVVAFIISSISYARIPVMSAIAPLLSGNKMDIVTGDENNTVDKNNKGDKNNTGDKNNKATNSQCCTPVITLERLEKENPSYINISRGFYLVFAMMFGTVFAKGIAIVCNDTTTNNAVNVVMGAQTNATLAISNQIDRVNP